MKSKKEVILLESEELNEMEEFINNCIRQGYEMHGDIKITKIDGEAEVYLVYHQVMIKQK